MITNITNGLNLNGSKVHIDSLDITEIAMALRKTHYFLESKPPKVAKSPPPTIDQMVASAKARLQCFIQAECDWLSLNLSKEFNEAKKSLESQCVIWRPGIVILRSNHI